jgi:hypothetical protein
MLNGDAHHSTEVEGELRIRPLLVCKRARHARYHNLGCAAAP